MCRVRNSFVIWIGLGIDGWIDGRLIVQVFECSGVDGRLTVQGLIIGLMVGLMGG